MWFILYNTILARTTESTRMYTGLPLNTNEQNDESGLYKVMMM